MKAVFISGLIGLMVFDAYRIYRMKLETGAVQITFGDYEGKLVHIVVYVAAGILAVMTNLDVVNSCCKTPSIDIIHQDLIGACMRGFGLGAVGPAGLASWVASKERGSGGDTGGKSINDLSNSKSRSRVLGYFKRFFTLR